MRDANVVASSGPLTASAFDAVLPPQMRCAHFTPKVLKLHCLSRETLADMPHACHAHAPLAALSSTSSAALQLQQLLFQRHAVHLSIVHTGKDMHCRLRQQLQVLCSWLASSAAGFWAFAHAWPHQKNLKLMPRLPCIKVRQCVRQRR